MSLINHSYETVQTILNKNNKGILTPARFNVLAKHAQLTVFLGILDEYRTALTKEHAKRSGVDVNILESELSVFFTEATFIGGTAVSSITLPSGIAWLPERFLFYKGIEVADMKLNGFSYHKTSITAPSLDYPQCKRFGGTIKLYPNLVPEDLELHYFRNPKTPKWTYEAIGSTAMFDGTALDYQDFELPESRIVEITISILELAGLHINHELAVKVAEIMKNEQFTKNQS